MPWRCNLAFSLLIWGLGLSLSVGTMETEQNLNAATCTSGSNVYDLLKNNRESFLTRQGTELYLAGQVVHFSGANIYWVGLGENGGEHHNEVNHPTHPRIDDALCTAYDVLGATAIRVHTAGISLGHPLSFHPTLTEYNHTNLEPVDWMIFHAKKKGMRVIIPLTDYWDFYHGGRYTFTRWRNLNVDAFWTNPIIEMDWHGYIYELLTHVNIYTGVAYKDDPTIVVWETGNELKNVPLAWTTATCQYIKSVSPKQLVLSGSFGPNPAEFSDGCLDILSNHYYHSTMQDLTTLNKDIVDTKGANKVFLVGEYGWPDCSLDQLKSFLVTIEQAPEVGISLFWSIFPHDDVSGWRQHHDGYSFYYPGVNQNTQTRMVFMREHMYCMARSYPSPGFDVVKTPANLQITPEGLLTWRGACGAHFYSVFRKLGSAVDWGKALTTTLTDFDGPFSVPAENKCCYDYAMVAHSFDLSTNSPMSSTQANTFC